MNASAERAAYKWFLVSGVDISRLVWVYPLTLSPGISVMCLQLSQTTTSNVLINKSWVTSPQYSNNQGQSGPVSSVDPAICPGNTVGQ